ILDKDKNQKIYLDPLPSNSRKITKGNWLYDEIELLSTTFSCLLEWPDVGKWPITEPAHQFQTDNYNCGIFTCVFARRMMNREKLRGNIDPLKERLNIANVLFSLSRRSGSIEESS
ncbi:Hypothetical predicted protein, partial [Paramuricea clavata]